MKNYILKLNNFLHKIGLADNARVAVCESDIYLINIYGFSGHVFSIKICTFPENAICFFGYNEEIILPLNGDSFNKIIEISEKAVTYGARMVEIKDGKPHAVYEFIAPTRLTKDLALTAYKTVRIDSGKYTAPCTLACSDFKGDNVFDIGVTA